MIAKKKEFYGGVGLLIGFIIVLIIFFSPVFNGNNGLDYLDNLYNTISKGSANYIGKCKTESRAFDGNKIAVSLNLASNQQAEQTARLFRAGGAEAAVSESQLKVSGDLGKILDNCLNDAEAMYYNEGDKVSKKYGYDERQALYNWWKAFQGMDKDLKRQNKFKEAKVIGVVQGKAVETAYNYYQIPPEKIGDKVWIVIFSLAFYVIYTLWYGFAILFMFEGWGLRIEH